MTEHKVLEIIPPLQREWTVIIEYIHRDRNTLAASTSHQVGDSDLEGFIQRMAFQTLTITGVTYGRRTHDIMFHLKRNQVEA